MKSLKIHFAFIAFLALAASASAQNSNGNGNSNPNGTTIIDVPAILAMSNGELVGLNLVTLEAIPLINGQSILNSGRYSVSDVVTVSIHINSNGQRTGGGIVKGILHEGSE